MNALNRLPLLIVSGLMALVPLVANAQSPSQGADFAKYAEKLRENALLRMEPTVQVQTSTRQAQAASTASTTNNSGGGFGRSISSFFGLGSRYPWKENIITTVFWIGEGTTARNPTPNRSSSWDPNWMGNFGGVDSPERRSGYLPVGFIPGQNPFYCALPYNDVTHGTTKPEASFVIPWFRQAFQQPGKSVCKGRWLAIRFKNRVCYAQWEDCGPFRTDHWQYVFGREQPKPNINGGAGLDISPAVRDFLGINGISDVCDWKFVDFSEVPNGPWARFGDNNDFVINARKSTERVSWR
jgi:hypothetical protein